MRGGGGEGRAWGNCLVGDSSRSEAFGQSGREGGGRLNSETDETEVPQLNLKLSGTVVGEEDVVGLVIPMDEVLTMYCINSRAFKICTCHRMRLLSSSLTNAYGSTLSPPSPVHRFIPALKKVVDRFTTQLHLDVEQHARLRIQWPC